MTEKYNYCPLGFIDVCIYPEEQHNDLYLYCINDHYCHGVTAPFSLPYFYDEIDGIPVLTVKTIYEYGCIDAMRKGHLYDLCAAMEYGWLSAVDIPIPINWDEIPY